MARQYIYNVHAVQGLVSVLGMILNVHYLSSVWWRNTQLWEEEITATSPVHVVWHLPTMKHLMSKQQCKKIQNHRVKWSLMDGANTCTWWHLYGWESHQEQMRHRTRSFSVPAAAGREIFNVHPMEPEPWFVVHHCLCTFLELWGGNANVLLLAAPWKQCQHVCGILNDNDKVYHIPREQACRTMITDWPVCP